MKLEHDSMELFGARADRPIKTCLREVSQSDVAVIIVGFRYGTIVRNLGISFTEAEYREAIRLGKPCLVYLRDEATPLPPRLMERDPQKLALLDAFRNTLLEQHTVATFKDAADLTIQITLDLRQLMDTMDSTPADLSRSKDATAAYEIQRLLEFAQSERIPSSELVSVIRRAVASFLVASGRRSPSVYLCYATGETALAEAIQARLSTEGVSVSQPSQRPESEAEFVREIGAAFDNTLLAVVLVSRQLLQGVWSRREVDMIVARRMSRVRSAAVLPVLIDGAPPPSVLRDLKSLNVESATNADACDRICKAVLTRLSEGVVWGRGFEGLPNRAT
jgi:hypothetical protein